MGCGCNDKRRVPGYKDLSCLPVTPWEQAKYILGLDECGRPLNLDKPLYELSEEDRDKLDALVIDGEGDKFLSDDGTYKELAFNSESLILEGSDNAINFVINNQEKLSELWESCLASEERFVRVTMEPYTLPLSYAYGTRSLILEYDEPQTEDGENYSKLRIHIGLRTDVYPFQVVYYDVATYVDADGIVITNGDGSQALYNDGSYKQTYTKQQVDDMIETLTDLINNGGDAVRALETRVDEAEIKINQNSQSIQDLQTSTETAFGVVNTQLDELGNRLTTAEGEIAVNTSDIESIRQEINETEKFRGYFETTNEITSLPNPTPGDYAWNAETGTVWIYNGTTWANSGDVIPDQTVDASDNNPLVDGIASPGTSNRYSRGDHRHPSDPTKANVVDLDEYFPLTGNDRSSRITGDAWFSSGNKVRLTNSGNSYIGQNSTNNTTEVVGNGVGGIDLVAGNGTVKANGEEVVTYDANDDIQAKGDIVLRNDHKLLGYDATGSDYNLIELSRFDIIDAGSTAKHFNITSKDRPTVQLPGETGAQSHDIAFVSEIDDAKSEIDGRLDMVEADVASNTTDIEANTTEIENLRQALADEENFRGYYLTTNQITAIENPRTGNFAWNAQTGTVWLYNGITWYDSSEPIPSGAVTPSSQTPPIPSGSGYVGTSGDYMRADAVIPQDPQKADASALFQTNQNVTNLRTDFEQYVTDHAGEVEAIDGRITANTTAISGLSTRVTNVEDKVGVLESQASTIEGDIVTLQNQQAATSDSLSSYITSNDLKVNDLDSDVNALKLSLTDYDSDIQSLQGRVSANEVNISQNSSDISSIMDQLSAQENFRGYFLTNAEIQALTATEGDYAWSAESGTVWIYTGNAWTDSTTPIPSGVGIEASDSAPLVDGTASAGSSTTYSRGDHRHPTDTTRASQTALNSLSDRVDGIETTVGNHTSAISTLQTQVADIDLTPLEDDISALQSSQSALQGRVTTAEGNITTLRTDVDNLTPIVNSNTSRISALEGSSSGISGDITTLQSQVSGLQDAIDALPKHIALTRAEYDGIATKDPNTFYYIYE